MSLGEVFRYNHTVDTYNNTFLALRMVIPYPIEKDEGETGAMINYKYVEFRDGRDDWNCSLPPLERELYDLDRDPYELTNLISTVSTPFLRSLQAKVQRMFNCQGESCRREQAKGFNSAIEDRTEEYVGQQAIARH